ncbi:MAG: crossover junction endodeoxyribonuclease RuvC [Alkalispirochaeta sp.]
MPLVLGIDPGLASTGWGVIRGDRGRISCVGYGVVRTASSQEVGERLGKIYDAIVDMVRRYAPDAAGIEGLYFTKNTTSAIPVAQARGVVLLALNQLGVPAREFTPQVIKQGVVGTGQADKEQVMQMVRIVLGMEEVPRPDHAADALAAAVTMLHSGSER